MEENKLVSKKYMTGDHERSGLTLNNGHGSDSHRGDPFQGVDFTRDRAAMFDINHWKASGVVNIARHNHVRPAEEHNRVAVTVGRGLVKNFDTFAVEVHVPVVGVVDLRRPCGEWKLRALTGWSAHAR